MDMTRKQNLSHNKGSVAHHQGPKKHKQVRRNVKVMLTCFFFFFYSSCVVHHERHHQDNQSIRSTTWRLCDTFVMPGDENDLKCGWRETGKCTMATRPLMLSP